MGPSGAQAWQGGRALGTQAPQQRRDRHDESWVEISSQPSSSSLSSVGDEVITTGLTIGGGVGQGPRHRRRLNQRQRQRRSQPSTTVNISSGPSLGTPATNSSQDEYDDVLESEDADDDNALVSSGERLLLADSLPATPSRRIIKADTDTDDDENATALGRRVPGSPPMFRPQPNAFSHPPVACPAFHTSRQQQQQHPHSAVGRGPSNTRNNHNHMPPPNVRHESGPSFGPAYQAADNDAALRASLTTLLSLGAAAARKDVQEDGMPVRPGGRVSPGSHPMELRFIQEAELLADSPKGTGAGMRSPTRDGSHNTAAAPPGTATGGKSRRSGVATKRKRPSVDVETPSLISPTLMTWMVSAGVVVLVSVVGFGAGYVIGREVGRHEVGVSASVGGVTTTAVNVTETAAGCGREVILKGGSRLRWGSGIARSVVA